MAFSYPEVVGEDEGARQKAQAMVHILRMFTIRRIEMDAFLGMGKGRGVNIAEVGPPTELFKVSRGGLHSL
jgi:hypothetical protein